MKTTIKTLAIFFLVLLAFSCGDDYLNKVDRTSINSASFYNNEADAIASVNATYAVLQSINLWGRRFEFMMDFASDEVAKTDNTQGAPIELLTHTFGPGTNNEHINHPWNSFYRLIAKANITIKNVGAMPAKAINDDAKNKVLAQARFLRALGYFYINTLWNGGPLRTDTNSDMVDVPRASAAEIWTLVESDLAEAAKYLPAKWDADNLGRAPLGAAKALLGKALLFQGKYAAAETQLMAVINSGDFYLLGGANDPLGKATTVEEAIIAMRKNHDFGVKNPEEAIFEVQFSGSFGGFSWSGNDNGRNEGTIRPHEYGVKGFSFYNCKVSPNLVAEFEGNGGTDIGDRDPRMEAFFFTQNSTVAGKPFLPIFNGQDGGYMWKKYEDSNIVSINGGNDCNIDVIRLADVYLMAAEARIQQDKVNEGVALINVVRRRADPTAAILPDVANGLTKTAGMTALIHERRVELCGEQTRRLDAVRWGIAKDVFASVGFQAGKHEYFPIPQGEIDANQSMTIADQNPGYN